ncbi:hypothetical protein PtrSN002B_012178, partial [Pyrenophora tritici-repentis]
MTEPLELHFALLSNAFASSQTLEPGQKKVLQLDVILHVPLTIDACLAFDHRPIFH